jgi:predicted alpha/beta hydrolase
MASSSRAVAFRADDGFELHGRLFGEPTAAQYALIIVPAMGVPQRFYAEVMAQWRRWCLHRDYLLGEGGEARRARYAGITTPILSLSFTDDEFMSLRNTESIHGFYVAAPKRMDRIAPADLGVRRIGHFGFFRKPSESTQWPRVAGWLSTPHISPMETAR